MVEQTRGEIRAKARARLAGRRARERFAKEIGRARDRPARLAGLKSRQVGELANKQAASLLASPDSHGQTNYIRLTCSFWLDFKRDLAQDGGG